EAGEKSGARITARHALEQYREVYAVPGPIDSPLSMYTNQLISEGAKLVASSDQILEDYFPEHRIKREKQKQKKEVELTIEAKHLLDCLALDQPIGVEELVTQGKVSVSSALQSLLELEIKGVVAKRADARYVRVQ